MSNSTWNLIAPTLGHSDLKLFSSVALEWHNAPTLESCFSQWKKSVKEDIISPLSDLHVLCFNVRGLDYRWGEVVLLSTQHASDILVLTEVGRIDHSLVAAAFPKYQSFYQGGENRNGGVLILVRQGLSTIRHQCNVSNVCVVDILLEESLRIIGVYAPESKSWNWHDISPFVNHNCVLMGDFNIDLQEDKLKREVLLSWTDSHALSPIIPDGPTSLRSHRTIDYAFTSGVHLSLQTYKGDTTSDHLPLIGILACDGKEQALGKRINWTVFSAFMSYTFSFWEKEWLRRSYNTTYNNYIEFLALLSARCTQYFSLKLARTAVPYWLRDLLAKSRTLSLKAKRTGDMLLRREQLCKMVAERYKGGTESSPFWIKSKRHFRDKSASLRAFISMPGEIIKDTTVMAESAANYYEELFTEPEVYRPHPYIDSQPILWDNNNDTIPLVSYPELVRVLKAKKQKSSCEAHGLSPMLLDRVPKNYWYLMIPLFNLSLQTIFMPEKWKDVRMAILAKKEPICTPDATRPISLLDCHLKVIEKLFLSSFLKVLNDRGLLPDNQSGFRANHRLQSRFLLLIDQISSLMANNSPVCTVFVDFRSAFDQLWFDGYVGKLSRLGIPAAYVAWIKEWLTNRRGYIDIQGTCSRWFPIKRGGPQGSSLTPSVFITYHSDMSDAFPMAMSFLFADDVAATMAGQMGIKYTDQCIDLEKRLASFFDNLEYYSVLSVQPINYKKTHAMWTARAVSYLNPMPILKCGEHIISWTNQFKYLGYWISTKLGWSSLGMHRTRVQTG
ncbi:unnamed protein product [Rotaria socialis]